MRTLFGAHLAYGFINEHKVISNDNGGNEVVMVAMEIAFNTST